MVSDGYPIKFSANNTKGEYIALGLKKAGCKVAMLDEFYGTKGVLSAEKGVSDSGLDYLLLPRVGKVLSPFYTLPQIWKYLRERKEKVVKPYHNWYEVLSTIYFGMFYGMAARIYKK